MIKVKWQAELTGKDGQRAVVRSVEMPAPPSAGLRLLGRGCTVAAESVSFAPASGEYHVVCAAVRDEQRTLAELLRDFEIEGWRPAAR